MKAIMYHYIRRFDKEYPGFRFLDVDNFVQQLDYFQDRWGFLAKEEFLESIDTGVSRPGVVLTFDDGFKEHYNTVLPLLRERGLWGLFYIPTAHYTNEKKELLDVHRIHYLVSKYDSATLLNEINHNIDSSMIEPERLRDRESELYLNQANEESVLQFKKLMNYYLKYEHKKPILDFLANKYLTEAEIYDKLYLTIEELQEIENHGNIVGAHTHNHKVLSRLNTVDQKEEIDNSFLFLNSFLNMDVKSFCYPYGTAATFNTDTIKILSDLKVHHAFMFTNTECGQTLHRYQIERIDCNRF